ncbi:albusnodin family lasso peptide [Streptomyces sp. A1277]|nr:albusnodin family lasso peptide [Streptomyces sp. A1277]THA32480.1 albusnodin family lasso peptide [Streptomyces sp. A1277]
MNQEVTPGTSEETDDVPAVVVLGDAAALTRGSSSTSVEGKQTPYS